MLKNLEMIEHEKKYSEKIQEYTELLKPITKEEFAKILSKEHNLSITEAASEAQNFFANAAECGFEPSKQDALDLYAFPENKCDSISHAYNKNAFKKSYHIPSFKPLHPLPDITSFNPEDYYGISERIMKPLDHFKSYDLPGIEKEIPTQEKKILSPKFKQVSGRKRPIKYFCTLAKIQLLWKII